MITCCPDASRRFVAIQGSGAGTRLYAHPHLYVLQGMQARESETPTNDSIKAVSIKSLVADLSIKRGFDILKVDIEGAEATVFQDPQLLAMLPEVPLVSIEVHDRYQADASKVVADAFSQLDFNESRSGEYTVFTNAHPHNSRSMEHTQSLRVPFHVVSHNVVENGFLVLVGAGLALLALCLLSRTWCKH